MRKYVSYLCSDVQRGVLSRALISMQLGHFFEAHEAFEELFKACSGEGRLLFRGLAQLAAAHHQLTLGRARASVRTWHKARLKLASVGMLSARHAASMDAFHARLGIDEDGPRFIDVAQLGSPQSFPLPLDECDHTPSA